MVLAACGADRKTAADGMRAIFDESGGAIGWRATGSAFWPEQLDLAIAGSRGGALPLSRVSQFDTEEKGTDYSLVLFQRGAKPWKMQAISQMAPTTVSSSVRTREYLTTREIERLMAAARESSRYGHRDATMILIGYRHGLRASELCDLQWSQVELSAGRLHVRRAKSGSPGVHPMQGEEIRALRRLQREQGPSSHVFMSERGGPMTPKAFHALFGRIGARAKMPFPIHPHMLRHGCGYALANAGHDTRALQAYLGHKNIQHTVRYTELAPHRFKDFWR